MVCLLLVSTAYAQLNPTITVDNNSGYAPLGVNFEATAEGNVAEWVWDFGYGYTTTGQNVFHEYQTPGEYQAYLTMSDFEGGRDSIFIYITVSEQTGVLNAYFNANDYSGFAPLTLNFYDESSGNISSWNWDFDDDGIVDSYEQNPTYTFQNSGTYTVQIGRA